MFELPETVGDWRIIAVCQPNVKTPATVQDVGVVLAVRPSTPAAVAVGHGPVEYVVWNLASGGYSCGDYGFELVDAWDEYGRRARRLISPAAQVIAHANEVDDAEG